jgi:hypothetical protein
MECGAQADRKSGRCIGCGKEVFRPMSKGLRIFSALFSILVAMGIYLNHDNYSIIWNASGVIMCMAAAYFAISGRQ